MTFVRSVTAETMPDTSNSWSSLIGTKTGIPPQTRARASYIENVGYAEQNLFTRRNERPNHEVDELRRSRAENTCSCSSPSPRPEPPPELDRAGRIDVALTRGGDDRVDDALARRERALVGHHPAARSARKLFGSDLFVRLCCSHPGGREKFHPLGIETTADAGSSPSESPNTRTIASARRNASGVSTSIQRLSPMSHPKNLPRAASARTPSDSEQSPEPFFEPFELADEAPDRCERRRCRCSRSR